MTNIKYIALVAAFFAAGCTGYTEDEITIAADRTQIVADGTDAAQLTVDFQGRDVTAEATITETATGDVIADGVFTTGTPGAYMFAATYNGMQTLLPVTVMATRQSSATEDPASGRFYRRVAILEFTGTWCRYCTEMATYIKSVETVYPDRNVMLAVHVNDGLAIPYAATLADMFRASALPAAVIDFGSPVTNLNTGAADMERRIREAVEASPAPCGIAVSTRREGGEAVVTVKLLAGATDDYALAVALAEDGITGYPQLMPDGSTQAGYLHDHTLRAFHQNNVEGIALGEVVAGAQVEREFRFDLKGYNADLCRFAVIATTVREGRTVVANAAGCMMDRSVGVQYEKE